MQQIEFIPEIQIRNDTSLSERDRTLILPHQLLALFLSVYIYEGCVMSKKLFVGNVSMKTTEDELYSLFSQVGQILNVFSPGDLKTGYRSSYCFIDVETHEDGQKVIDRFDGYLLNNNLLIVSDMFPTQSRLNPSDGR